MERGELIFRRKGGDEAYWFAVGFLLSIAVCKFLNDRGALSGETLALSLLGLLAVMTVIRLTLLRSWNVSRLAWSIDETTLTLGDTRIPLSAIRSVELRGELANKNSWLLVIRAGRVLRFFSVALGAERAESLHSFRRLAQCLTASAERTGNGEA